MDIEVTTVLTTMDVDGMERDKPRMSLLLQDQTLMLTLMLMAGDTMEDTTVLTTTDTGMERDKPRMSLLPLDQTPMLMLMLMAGDTMVDTTVLTTMDGMERDKPRMSLLPLDQTLMLMLTAGDTGEDTTVLTMEVTTGANKIVADTNISSKYFSSNNNLAAPVVMVIW